MKKTLGSKIVYIILMLFCICIVIYIPFADKMKSNTISSKFYTQEAFELATNAIENINKIDVRDIEKIFIPNLTDFQEGLVGIRDILDENPIEDYYLIGSHKNTSNNTIYDNLTFQAKHKTGYSFITISIISKDEKTLLQSFNINLSEKPIEDINKFYKDDMDLKRWSLIIIGYLLTFFVILTISHYFFTAKNTYIRYLLLLSLSLGAISFSWNDLLINFNPLSFSINTISIARPGNIGEWTYKFSIPIFSIIYWFGFRQKLVEKEIKKDKRKHISNTNEDLI